MRNVQISTYTNNLFSMFIYRFFQKYPKYQELFPKLKNLKTEEEIKENMAFENQAVAIFTVFDETMEHIESLDKAMHGIRIAAQAHSTVPGFEPQFFTVSANS